jgi:hypothetical protein
MLTDSDCRSAVAFLDSMSYLTSVAKTIRTILADDKRTVVDV